MLKFTIFAPRYSTDILEIENPCSAAFGLTEIAIPAVAGLLSSVGIGTATSGVLASGLVNAGIGAGLGALTGNPGAGAAMGGLNGIFGGGGGALSNALGLGGGGAPGGGALNAAAGQQPSTGVAGQLFAPPSGPAAAPTTGASGALAATSAGAARGLAPGSGPLAILAALAQMSNRQQPNSAPTPPGMNDPFNPNGPAGTSRTQVQDYTPAGPNGFYTYGQQSQPEFFNNNQVHLAHGGALSQALARQRMAQGGDVFSTGGGQHRVMGPGGGQDDEVNARLSPDEFVMDASTTSKLGDGSSKEGAHRMEVIRHAINEDTRSKGVVQRKARSPLEYLAEARKAA